jgi:DNA-binding CsgD family transcriptional regulator/PAS domain-containing protein
VKTEIAPFELVGGIYEAALEPALWPGVLGNIVQAVGARSCFLRQINYAAARVEFSQTVGYDPGFAAAYTRHFVQLDPYVEKLKGLSAGSWMSSEQVLPLQQRRKTEYHNDYERPQGIREGFACLLDRSHNSYLQFAFQRGFNTTAFLDDAPARRLITTLTPHLARSMRLHRQLGRVGQQNAWTLEALNCLQVGVILTNSAGRPFFVNRAAQALLGARLGVTLDSTGLQLQRSNDAAQVRRLLEHASRIIARENSNAPDSMSVALSNGKMLQIQVSPLLPQQSALGDSIPHGSLAWFLSLPGQQRLPWQKIAAIHGLTRTEAKVASALAAGVSLEHAAQELNVSVTTARSHLRSIFLKLGVGRQPELVALLLTGVNAYLADHLQV